MASQKCAKNKYRTHTKFCGLNFHGLKERKVCTCVSVINSVGNFFVIYHLTAMVPGLLTLAYLTYLVD